MMSNLAPGTQTVSLVLAHGAFDQIKYVAWEIKKAQGAGDPDTGETYYHHWLATLERMAAEKGVTSAESLAHHYRAWSARCTEPLTANLSN